MGLKDEIIEQKQRAKEQAKLEAENAARERAQKFIELKENYEKGIVPQEWMDLYDKYELKIREWYSKNSKNFYCREPVSEEYYRSKADFGDDEVDELTLMNEYLTKRLRSDGFDGAQFKLIEDKETYLTDEDWARYRTESAEDNRRIMDNYREALWNEISKDAGGDVNNVAAPWLSTVSLHSTGTRKVYYIEVRCYLEFEDENKDNNEATPPPVGMSKEAFKLWSIGDVLKCGGAFAGIGFVAAIILLFTISLVEYYIPVFAVAGFVYGFLLGLFIFYVKLAAYANKSKKISKGTRMRFWIRTLMAVLCIILLIAAIVGGVIGVLKLI